MSCQFSHKPRDKGSYRQSWNYRKGDKITEESCFTVYVVVDFFLVSDPQKGEVKKVLTPQIPIFFRATRANNHHIINALCYTQKCIFNAFNIF